jgi:Glycosyltransferase family 87
MVVASTAYMVVHGGQVDWLTYQHAAQRLVAGEPIYAAAQLQGPYHLTDVVLIGYAYPPPSVVLFLPFALGDPGRLAWLALNIGVFMAGLTALTHIYARQAFLPVLALLLATLAVFGPYTEAVATGNSSLGMAGLLAWAMVIGGRGVGPWAGVAAVSRVTPGLIAMLAPRGELRRQLLLAALTGIVLVVATLPLVGIESWRDYLISLSGAVPTCDGGVSSLTCYLTPTLGLGAAKAISLGLAVLIALAAARTTRPLLAAGAVAVAIVLPLPDLWPHYLLFIFVPLWAALAGAIGRVACRSEVEPEVRRRASGLVP